MEFPSTHPVVHVAGVRNCTVCNGFSSSDTFSHIRHSGSIVSICSPQCMTKFQSARNRYVGGCILPRKTDARLLRATCPVDRRYAQSFRADA